MLLPAFTGTGDLYWYVRADSPIKTLKDTTAQQYHRVFDQRSSSNNIVVAFAQELGVKAKPTATGSPPGTLTQVMTGQIDIGWAAPPFGIKDIKDGKIRIVARGSDIPSLNGQTVRAIIVNADALKTKRDAIMRFAKGYREAVDWMYADPKALEMYSEKVKQPVDILRESLAEFHPKSAMQSETDAGSRRRGDGRREAQIPRCAAEQGAACGVSADTGEVRRDVIPEAAQRLSGIH